MVDKKLSDDPDMNFGVAFATFFSYAVVTLVSNLTLFLYFERITLLN